MIVWERRARHALRACLFVLAAAGCHTLAEAGDEGEAASKSTELLQEEVGDLELELQSIQDLLKKRPSSSSWLEKRRGLQEEMGRARDRLRESRALVDRLGRKHNRIRKDSNWIDSAEAEIRVIAEKKEELKVNNNQKKKKHLKTNSNLNTHSHQSKCAKVLQHT